MLLNNFCCCCCCYLLLVKYWLDFTLPPFYCFQMVFPFTFTISIRWQRKKGKNHQNLLLKLKEIIVTVSITFELTAAVDPNFRYLTILFLLCLCWFNVVWSCSQEIKITCGIQLCFSYNVFYNFISMSTSN